MAKRSYWARKTWKPRIRIGPSPLPFMSITAEKYSGKKFKGRGVKGKLKAAKRFLFE